MAQQFLNQSDPTFNSNDHISGAATLSAAYPVTMNVWFYPPDPVLSGQFPAISVGNNSDISHHRLAISNTTYRVIGRTVESSGSGTNVNVTSTFTANTWHMATYVCTSATSRTVYLNAGGSATTTVSRTVTAPTNWIIGGYYQQFAIPAFEGYLAEFSVWDAALTSDEITSLYQGMRADKVRPQNLKVYVPIVRNFTDMMGTTTSITSSFPSGATTQNHVRRYG